jgi:hypothetical protein
MKPENKKIETAPWENEKIPTPEENYTGLTKKELETKLNALECRRKILNENYEKNKKFVDEIDKKIKKVKKELEEKNQLKPCEKCGSIHPRQDPHGDWEI